MSSPASAPRAYAAPALAASAYSDAQGAAVTPRQAEYRVFAKATHRLSDAAKALATDEPGAFPRLAAALHDNQRLWTALAVDAASDGNGLPESLRAGIVSLAGFVRGHSAKVLAGDAAAGPLIDINAALMKGLRGEGGAD
ncbi:MAG: flagellar biosynthesis regulator FlaF [Pseudomonadota bacterium]